MTAGEDVLAAPVVAPAGMPVHFRDVPGEVEGDLTIHRVHSDLEDSGLELSVLVLAPGAQAERAGAPGRDEVLYVLTGSGEVVVAGVGHPLSPEIAVLTQGDYELRAGEGQPLEVAAVTGRVAGAAATGGPPVTIDLADRAKHPAVSSREYQVLVDPDSGCSGMTQFVGYVPAVRTPRHIHPYDEMLIILSGSGLIEINGTQQEVSAGWCYYLPRGTPHVVQNPHDELLIELGVFTPAGSPAQNTPVE